MRKRQIRQTGCKLRKGENRGRKQAERKAALKTSGSGLSGGILWVLQTLLRKWIAGSFMRPLQDIFSEPIADDDNKGAAALFMAYAQYLLLANSG